MHAYSQTLHYEHLRGLGRQIIEIDKVNIGSSLSPVTSSTIENTTPLNSTIFAPIGVERRIWDATYVLVPTNSRHHGKQVTTPRQLRWADKKDEAKKWRVV
jgi:hypothetical protein